MRYVTAFILLAAVLTPTGVFGEDAAGALALDSQPKAHFEFSGPVGERIDANVENWLLRAPTANPGMLEMFRVRDRRPAPTLVPWAGEFVGKYLISAVQSLRLTTDPRLNDQVKAIVAEFISTQADDGYLGPFPKSERLLKHWDLWGHYHALLALAMWHEYSGDVAALQAARRAADLVCATYLDTNRRVFDAGDHEMNMAILTGMAMMHRLTGEQRYLKMAREVEKDWERAGDYLRAAQDGREFFESPRPRWESLHDLQGLVELWRITGEQRYADAFVHHWRSIRRWDRRNTGGFSSGEQATGNPFAPTAIETCCTVAWMALTIDYLRLTGDAAAAEELEFSTLNAGIGSQHPSGRWWTYNTPMDGVREASAHTIVFQARAGTSELNCCSVSGPRVLGMLSEWAVMSSDDGLVLNWLGAGRFTVPLADGTPVTIVSSNDAWRDGQTTWQIEVPKKTDFTLSVRVPSWAGDATVKLNGSDSSFRPGDYLRIQQSWKSDRIEFKCRPAMRTQPGARETEGKVSLNRGPILLAFDQAHNATDDDNVPAIDFAKLDSSRVVSPADPVPSRKPSLTPWLIVDVPTLDGRSLRLVDFASAGASGTRYLSWLPAKEATPPPALPLAPQDGARVPPGKVFLRWLGSQAKDIQYRVEFAFEPNFFQRLLAIETADRSLEFESSKLEPPDISDERVIYWRIVTRNSTGETIPNFPYAWFQLDLKAAPQKRPIAVKSGPGGELIVHSLRENEPIQYGKSSSEGFVRRSREGTELNGKDQKLIYEVQWPESDFAVSLNVTVNELPRNRMAQVFSAWAGVMDDPLRIVVEGGKIFARVESGAGYSTPGAPIEPNRNYKVAAVKRDATLTLYVEGSAIGSCMVPVINRTQTKACALGGNPRFAGNEHLAARFADFRFHARALSDDEIRSFNKSR